MSGTSTATMRSVLAVIAGYAMFAIPSVAMFKLSGREPHAAASPTFIAITTVSAIGFAFLAGAIAAWLSRRRPVVHASIVGAVIALGAVASLLNNPGNSPIWSQLSALMLAAPSAFLGGRWWAGRGL